MADIFYPIFPYTGTFFQFVSTNFQFRQYFQQFNGNFFQQLRFPLRARRGGLKVYEACVNQNIFPRQRNEMLMFERRTQPHSQGDERPWERGCAEPLPLGIVVVLHLLQFQIFKFQSCVAELAWQVFRFQPPIINYVYPAKPAIG